MWDDVQPTANQIQRLVRDVFYNLDDNISNEMVVGSCAEAACVIPSNLFK